MQSHSSTQQSLEQAVRALEAHAAWHWAEEKGLGSFNDSVELCKYAQWLTAKALNQAAPDKYEGVPHLLIWPSVYIDRAKQEDVQIMVDKVLMLYRDACKETTVA